MYFITQEAMYKNIFYLAMITSFSCLTASTETSSTPLTVTEDIYLNKHESLETCFSFDLSPEEYLIFPNKTALVPMYNNRTYEEPFYILKDDILIICAPPEVFEDEGPVASHYLEPMKYLTLVGITVSLVFLLIHLIVFCFFTKSHNLPGWNLASLCLSLFLSYVMMLISQSKQVIESNIACIADAALTQFFFLASFLWMFIMAFDVFRSILHATGSLRVSSKEFKVKKYIWSSIICWGTALVFTAAALIVDNIDGIHESFKPNFKMHCWFRTKDSLLAFFAGPVFTLIGINFILFGISAYNIFSNRMRPGEDSQRSNLKKNHWMYFRLAIIMGATWITGAFAMFVNNLWLWYLFAALNTFQGFFIFIAFTCTKNLKQYIKMKLLGQRRASQQTLTPTFQSYCHYGNSMEKDLDKVVDSQDKSQKIDHIVIHL